jgi:perosamine synthetase
MDSLQSELMLLEESFTPASEEIFKKIKETLSQVSSAKQLYGVQFEQQFAQTCGTVYAVSTYTSSVLRHVLHSLNLTDADEIICPGWIRPAYIRSILASKLLPIFSEINPYTLGLDYSDVSHKLSPRTKAVLLVHSFGIPSDIEAFATLCREKKLNLIEIVPCELGSTYKQKTLGTFGHAGIIEYHPQHAYSNQDSCILVTDIEAIARRVRSMSFYEHKLGTFSELQGALGLWDLNNQEQTRQQRKDVAQRFDRALGRISGVSVFHEMTVSQWGHQFYPIRVWAKYRDDLVEHLQRNHLDVIKPKRLAHVYSYIQTRLRPPQLLQTEKLHRETVLLPTNVNASDQERLIGLVSQFFKNQNI